jgi:hypothetical protein
MPFDPTRRQIFTYYDGSVDADGQLRPVRNDPITLYRKLIEAAGGEAEFDRLWGAAHATEPDPTGRRGADGKPVQLYTLAACAEQSRLADVVRQAFSLVPLEGPGQAGLTETEMLQQVYDFFAYQKKSWTAIGTTPRCEPPTQESTSAPSPETSITASG